MRERLRRKTSTVCAAKRASMRVELPLELEDDEEAAEYVQPSSGRSDRGRGGKRGCGRCGCGMG